MLLTDTSAPASKNDSRGSASSQPAFLRKLDQFTPLTADERAAIERCLKAKVQTIGAGVPLIDAGEAPSEVMVFLSGWACSRRASSNRRGQIIALHLPGDVGDFGALLKQHMDTSIVAMTEVKVAAITRAALADLMREQPRAAHAFWWDFMCASATRGEWITRLGRRSARERIASLICELGARLFVIGLADDTGFDCPLTQADLANCCGITTEHANRTLRQLRESGIVSLENGRLTFLDWDELRRVGEFRADFLHFKDLRPSALSVPMPDIQAAQA